MRKSKGDMKHFTTSIPVGSPAFALYLFWPRKHVSAPATNESQVSFHRSGRFEKPPTHEVSEDPMSPNVLSHVQSWLNVCKMTHTACNIVTRAEESNTSLPSRFIENNDGLLNGSKNPPKVKLTLNNGRCCRYVALSHCWGKTKTICLTRHVLSEFTTNIRWTELTKTFQDAIILSRTLGYTAIWIDSLCIKQDADDLSDWGTEAAKMQEYYELADVVIAATRADNGTKVFLGPPNKRSKSTTVSFDGATISIALYKAMFHDHLLGKPQTLLFDPILTRGWCYQERQLSRRILHYCRDEIVFECLELQACECGAFNANSHLSGRVSFKKLGDRGMSISTLVVSTSSTSPVGTLEDVEILIDPEEERSKRAEERWSLWDQAVNAYTALHLTKSSDRLPAISGIASRLHDPSLGNYLGGLWEQNLETHLLWSVADNANASRIGHPSWSWSAIDAPVTMAPHFLSSKYIATVVNAKCKQATESPYGEFESGALVLSARTTTIDLESVLQDVHGNVKYHLQLRLREDESAEDRTDVAVNLDIASEHGVLKRPLRIAVILERDRQAKLGRGYITPASYYAIGILLRKTEEVIATYSRLGVISIAVQGEARDMLRECLQWEMIDIIESKRLLAKAKRNIPK